MSVLQSVASAVLAPSLRHVADMLALSWRQRLTRSALAKYLVGAWAAACRLRRRSAALLCSAVLPRLLLLPGA